MLGQEFIQSGTIHIECPHCGGELDVDLDGVHFGDATHKEECPECFVWIGVHASVIVSKID